MAIEYSWTYSKTYRRPDSGFNAEQFGKIGQAVKDLIKDNIENRIFKEVADPVFSLSKEGMKVTVEFNPGENHHSVLKGNAR